MKVIIDLIEDIREAIDNDASFTLTGMALQANEEGEHVPIWQSNIINYRLDDETKKLFLFLGKEDPVSIGTLLEEFKSYSNEAMMYEVNVTYTEGDQRVDKSLIGFGEVVPEQRYLLFMSLD